jgi:hypothetical protein
VERAQLLRRGGGELLGGADVSHTIEADGATLTGNSDFSGDVEITWPSDVAIGDGDRAVRPMDGIRMPGHVFLALAKRVVGRQMFYAVEQAIDDWIGKSDDGSIDPSTTHGRGAV